MKRRFYFLTGIALVSATLGAAAFGERMIDPAVAVARSMATEPEANEPAEAAMSEDDERVKDPEMDSEPAEDREDEDDAAVSSPAQPPSRWKWNSAFSLSAIYDDNIFISPNHKQADEIVTLAADVGVTWGDFLKKEENFFTIQYAPSLILFANRSEQNAFEQRGSLTGQWRFSKLTLGAQLGAQSLSGGDVDVGDRADRNLYRIALTSRYDYSDKTSLEVNFHRNTADYRTNLDSVEWVNQDWVDYQIFPKTRLGVGMTLGYLEPEGSAAQTYQQALVRVTIPATGKLSVTASGGVEFRQLGDGAGNQTKPVFTFGASYRPFDGTEISLQASRQNHSSAAQAGQNYTATGVTASVRQRLFRRFFATFAGGYEDAQYETTSGQSSTSRHDQYLFARPSISYAFTKQMNLELYYQYRRNTSTAEFSSFDNNVAGLQATIRF